MTAGEPNITQPFFFFFFAQLYSKSLYSLDPLSFASKENANALKYNFDMSYLHGGDYLAHGFRLRRPTLGRFECGTRQLARQTPAEPAVGGGGCDGMSRLLNIHGA